jgi:hypothetical protein
VRISAVFRNLSSTQADGLLAFLESNRSGQIEWALDGKNYEGVLMTAPSIEREAFLHNITFEYLGIQV